MLLYHYSVRLKSNLQKACLHSNYKIFTRAVSNLRARRKPTKKLSLQIVNEDFEAVFNAAIGLLTVREEIFRNLGKNPGKAPFSQN